MHVLFFLWIVWLLLSTAVNISADMTINEDINKKKYSYLWRNKRGTTGEHQSPWDRGFKLNWQDFFGGFSRVDWYHLYELPPRAAGSSEV